MSQENLQRWHAHLRGELEGGLDVLLHDDVVDDGTTRRGRPTVNARWGNTVAVLSGELEEELPGWDVKVGPREAVELPGFMKSVLT